MFVEIRFALIHSEVYGLSVCVVQFCYVRQFTWTFTCCNVKPHLDRDYSKQFMTSFTTSPFLLWSLYELLILARRWKLCTRFALC